jgi:hypothetical protein
MTGVLVINGKPIFSTFFLRDYNHGSSCGSGNKNVPFRHYFRLLKKHKKFWEELILYLPG